MTTTMTTVATQRALYDSLWASYSERSDAADARREALRTAAPVTGNPSYVTLPCGKVVRRTAETAAIRALAATVAGERKCLLHFKKAIVGIKKGTPLRFEEEWCPPTYRPAFGRATELSIFKLHLSATAVVPIAEAVFSAIRAYFPELDGMWNVFSAMCDGFTDADDTASRNRAFANFLDRRLEAYNREDTVAKKRSLLMAFFDLLGTSIATWDDAPLSNVFVFSHILEKPSAETCALANEWVGGHMVIANMARSAHMDKYKRFHDE